MKGINSALPGVVETTSANFPDLTAFGEMPVGEFQPECAWRFPGIFHDLLFDKTETNGTVTIADNQAALTTTADPTSTVVVQTKRKLRYIPGIGGLARFTCLWPNGASAGSRQLIGIGDDQDGLFIGYNGLVPSISRRYKGTDNWGAISDCEDPLDGTGPSGINADFSKGNVFQIRYQWLGYGALTFYIEDSATGKFVRFHQVQYANANVIPSLNDPTLPLRAEIVKTASTDILIMKSPSGIAGTESVADGALKLPFATDGLYAYTAGAEDHVVIFRVKTEFPVGSPNRVRIFPNKVTAAVEGNKPAIVRVYGGPTLSAAGTWVDVETNRSVLEYNTTATISDNGILLDTIPLSKSGQGFSSFLELNLQQLAGDVSLITIESSGATELLWAVNWIEDH